MKNKTRTGLNVELGACLRSKNHVLCRWWPILSSSFPFGHSLPTPPREEIIHHILHKYQRAGDGESAAAATNCSAESNNGLQIGAIHDSNLFLILNFRLEKRYGIFPALRHAEINCSEWTPP